MKQFTVVISSPGDRRYRTGIRSTREFWWLASWFGGYAELGLFWFLCDYHGRGSVDLLRPTELAKSSFEHETEWLFVGLPTSLTAEQLRRIKYRKLILYDSTDFDGINFENSDKRLLCSEANLCLKTYRDHRWTTELPVGLLPIKRPPLNNKLRAVLKLSRLKEKSTRERSANKPFDVGFVARPTGNLETNERLRWLAELKSQRPDLKLWGGLVGDRKLRESVAGSGSLDHLDACWMGKRKVRFPQYFSGLCRSKVALAPCGFAPWTYRHFEAIYAGCVVVSNDLSHYDFLIPFPRQGMIEVQDGDPIGPSIDAALKLRANQPDIIEENVNHLEKWLDSGAYSRKRPATLERFHAQLEAA